ncbi:ABC transporter ATP-binding protein [Alicyclobacillus sp. ALC3]|uniref:ABC transporter ATP-binding protein n=1 Tax=Alicyclobacillus sp. ALC3 TaxID=2796143 RepID=UPI0023793519|nr:ABC transporter ATP-binding protein [Alicyclobacillus sp. ALC3]WDL95998.1 ABC transporter ATP-binding protein [Alicyclobacillus sp. ALC3]
MIELQHVSKRYRVGPEELEVLRGIDLTIGEGEFVSIMGPSGSGKSTLMHILGCLDTPTTGSYRLRGRAVQMLSSTELAQLRNQEIGFVFQNFHLLPRMSALRNVELPLVYAGTAKRLRRERAEALLAQMGLQDRIHHLPNELSGGQKQRVAIARALANEPALLLADEPTGALDSATGQDIMQLFRSLNDTGATVVVITHDANVASVADRIVRLQDGQVTDDGQRSGGSQP